MPETILVNISPAETRVAVLQDGLVQDIHVEREASRGMVGNIYSGKVVRVLPGMQAAFVDFGGERTGILRVSDLADKPAVNYGRTAREEPAIGDRLHTGEKLLVQVSRDPMGGKGARLTTDLSISSRFLVFLPRSGQLAVSQRIEDTGERARLLLMLQEGLAAEDLAAEGGYILRTAAEGVDLPSLREDLRFLKRVWAAVCRRSREATSPGLLYEDLPLHLRVARDLASPELEHILVDHKPGFVAMRQFCEEYVPELSGRLQCHAGGTALFEQYGAEDEIERALGRRVELACGGYLVIDETEAMTTIDVNTGSFVGRRNPDETVFRTNMEAAAALARQLRLRNLGGIIIVDFIDMADQEHRRRLHLALQEALQRDPVRTTLAGMTELGLVTMTRKRSGESLQRILGEQCPACHGVGAMKSAQTVCYEIFREIMRVDAREDGDELVVVAAQPVVSLLQGEESGSLSQLESATGKRIHLRAEPRYSRQHFDLAVL